jgi:chorismate synthase
VAAGAVAKRFLEQACGIEVTGRVVQFGDRARRDAASFDEFEHSAEEAAAQARANGETVGGVVEVTARNVPHGLGSYVTAESRLDSALAGALISIQAFKGVEIGDGFALASLPGSLAHDQIVRSADGTLTRLTNRAGGIEGGISNGMPIVLRAVVKPIPSIPGGLQTINTATGEATTAHSQRSDVSAVYPAAVVASSVVALTLADFVTRKFGADSLAEIKRNLRTYLDSIPDNIK